MKKLFLPLTAVLVLTANACSPRGETETNSMASPAMDAAAAAEAEYAARRAREAAEAARFTAVHRDCLERQASTPAESQAPPTVDGVHERGPQNRSFTSDWWLTNKPTTLRTAPDPTSRAAVVVADNAWVHVVEEIEFTVPVRGVVVHPGEGFGLDVCDIVYRIDSEDDEGSSTDFVWRHGRVFALSAGDDPAEPETGDRRTPVIQWQSTDDLAPLPAAGANRLGLWVRLEAQGGEAGWTQATHGDFDCMWANDRYIDDRPTICANPPT